VRAIVTDKLVEILEEHESDRADRAVALLRDDDLNDVFLLGFAFVVIFPVEKHHNICQYVIAEALYPPLLTLPVRVSSDYIITAFAVPGARGRIIVGTHRLVVAPSAEPMPSAAWLRIGIAASPEFTRFIQD